VSAGVIKITCEKTIGERQGGEGRGGRGWVGREGGRERRRACVEVGLCVRLQWLEPRPVRGIGYFRLLSVLHILAKTLPTAAARYKGQKMSSPVCVSPQGLSPLRLLLSDAAPPRCCCCCCCRCCCCCLTPLTSEAKEKEKEGGEGEGEGRRRKEREKGGKGGMRTNAYIHTLEREEEKG